jgi:hypothetical protein
MLKDSVSISHFPMKLIFSFQKGIAINFAPYRSKTLNKFVSIAETYSFECNVYEQYDEDVFNKHLQVNLFKNFHLKNFDFSLSKSINIIQVIFIIQFLSYYVNVESLHNNIFLFYLIPNRINFPF